MTESARQRGGPGIAIGSVQADRGEGRRGPAQASVDSGIGDCWDPATGLELISLAELGRHSTPEDGWMALYDRVYDVTAFLARHPGGREVMEEYLGWDATLAFRGVGHSRGAIKLMERFLIGILPPEERLGIYSS